MEPGLKDSISVVDSDFFFVPCSWLVDHIISQHDIVAETKQPSGSRRINALNGWCSIWRTEHVAIKLSKTVSSTLLFNKQLGNRIFVSNILWGTRYHQEGKEQMILKIRSLCFVHFPLLTLKNYCYWNRAGYHSCVNIYLFEWESQTSKRWTTTGSLRCLKDIYRCILMRLINLYLQVHYDSLLPQWRRAGRRNSISSSWQFHSEMEGRRFLYCPAIPCKCPRWRKVLVVCCPLEYL